MKRTILVRGARQLLTMQGPSDPRRGDALRELGVIEDGSLLITDGVISNVGPTRRIENLSEARSAEEINASGRVVMPCFNDPHVQLIGPPARVLEFPTGQEAAKITQSELSAAAQHFLKNTPPGRITFQGRRIVERYIRHGTTRMLSKVGFALDETAEAKALRASLTMNTACAAVASCFSVRAPAAQTGAQVDSYLDWVCSELLSKIRLRRLASFAEVVCEPDGLDIEQARTLLVCAKRLGFQVNLQAEQRTRMGVARLVVEQEVRNILGLNCCNSLDAEVLARSRTISTLLPIPVFQGRAPQYPPARMLIDMGAAVALGSDFSPSLPATYSMQPVLAVACTYMGLAPEEAISAATINAAHAIDQATITGSLEFGKQADLMMLDVPDYREIPYHLGVNLVELTMHKGEVVYREGHITCSAR